MRHPPRSGALGTGAAMDCGSCYSIPAAASGGRKARMGRKPTTGVVVPIASRLLLEFKVSDTLKRRLAGGEVTGEPFEIPRAFNVSAMAGKTQNRPPHLPDVRQHEVEIRSPLQYLQNLLSAVRRRRRWSRPAPGGSRRSSCNEDAQYRRDDFGQPDITYKRDFTAFFATGFVNRERPHFPNP